MVFNTFLVKTIVDLQTSPSPESAENRDLRTETPELPFELHSADTMAIGFMR